MDSHRQWQSLPATGAGYEPRPVSPIDDEPASQENTSGWPRTVSNEETYRLTPVSPLRESLDRISLRDDVNGHGGDTYPEKDLVVSYPATNLEDKSNLWVPKWLRRRVVSVFLGWFAVAIAAIGALTQYSNVNHGIAEPPSYLFYLWTFGPSAVFTIIAAVWERVNYQSMRLTPWMKLRQSPSVDIKILSLDYQSFLAAPAVLFCALRNHHYLVAFCTLISLLLRILVVLSTGLIFLHSTPLSTSVQAAVSDRISPENLVSFVNTSVLSETALIQLEGIAHAQGQPPFGFNPQGAFQIFEVAPGDGNDTTVSAVVAGFWAEVQCVPADTNVLYSSANGNTDGATVSTNSSLCQRGWEFRGPSGSLNTQLQWYVYFGTGSDDDLWCGPGGNGIFAQGFYFFNQTGGLIKSVAAHCKPEYFSGKVEVTNRGGKTQVKRLLSPAPTLLDWDLTRITHDILRNRDIKTHGTSTTNIYTLGKNAFEASTYDVTELPSPVRTGMKLGGRSDDSIPTLTEDLDPEALVMGLQNFYQQFTTLLVHSELRKPENATVSGVSVSSKVRLLVQSVISTVMVSILAVIFIVTAISMLFLLPKPGATPANPETILGIGLCLRPSADLLQRLSGSATATLSQTKALVVGTYSAYSGMRSGQGEISSAASVQSGLLEQGIRSREPAKPATIVSWYNPFIMRLVPRALMSVLLVGLISALVALQRISSENTGIARVGDTTYLHFLWTSVPTLLMVGVGLFFSAVDSQIRSLSGFIFMRSGTSANVQQANTSYADQTAITALAAAVRARTWSVVVSTSAVLLVAALTIFSATLFTVLPVPAEETVLLQTEQWFSLVDQPEAQVGYTFSAISTLELGTFDYPVGMYNNIIFPRLAANTNDTKLSGETATGGGMVTTNESESPSDPAVMARVRTPALRAGLECVLCPSERCNVSSQMSGQITSSTDPVFIQANVTAINGAVLPWNMANCGFFYIQGNFFSLWDREDGEFSLSILPGNRSTTACPTSSFVWGKVDYGDGLISGGLSIGNMAVMMCNDFLETIDVDVQLPLPSLQPDFRNTPPQVVEASASKVEEFLPPVPSIAGTQQRHLFVTLPSERYGQMPRSYVGEEKHNQAVMEAQMDWWKLAVASTLHSSGYWRNFGESAAPAANGTASSNNTKSIVREGLLDSTKPVPIEVAITDNTARRVVMNHAPTYALISLLAALLVLNLASLWLLPRKLVPKAPGSILGMASLMADSNMFARYPAAAEHIREGEVERAFDGLVFKMGWLEKPDGRLVYTIYTEDDGRG